MQMAPSLMVSGPPFAPSVLAAPLNPCPTLPLRSPIVVGAALWLRHALGAAQLRTAQGPYSVVQNKGVVRKVGPGRVEGKGAGVLLYVRMHPRPSSLPPSSPCRCPCPCAHQTVVWISRRNFEGLAQANLTPWQDQRRFSNEGGKGQRGGILLVPGVPV